MALGKGLNSLIPNKSGKRTAVREQQSAPATDANRLWHIPISEIVPNSEQPRRNFSHEDLEDLVASIKKHGILQPITVTEKEDGGYELIAGERRLRASTIAGLATVPALVRSATEQEKLELALIENIQRQDLNPIEEAFAFKRLIDVFGLTQNEVSERVGKSRPVITNTLRLLELPEEIKKALIDGKVSMTKARTLLSLKDEKDQLKMFRQMQEEGTTVRHLESAVARHGATSRKGSVRRDPNVLAQEQMLEERLGAKVRISLRGERGSIEISFHSKEELKRILEELL